MSEQRNSGLHGKHCNHWIVVEARYCDKPSTVCQGRKYRCDEHDPYALITSPAVVQPKSPELKKEQSLWDRINQVAESARNIPDWKRGSALNERVVEHPELPAMDYSMSAHEQCDERERQLLGVKAELLSAKSRIRELEHERDQRNRLMHGKVRFVPSAEDPKKCVCLYCVQNFEALADHAAEMEMELYLPGGWIDRAEKAEAERDALQELLGMDERGIAAIKNILAERDRLKSELETALQQRDAAMTGQTERQSQFEKMGDLADEAVEQRNTAEAKLSRILTITETPEWFDSPCARAAREVLEGK